MDEKLKNIVLDTNYSNQVNNWWYPIVNDNIFAKSNEWKDNKKTENNENKIKNTTNSDKKEWLLDKFIKKIIPETPKETKTNKDNIQTKTWESEDIKKDEWKNNWWATNTENWNTEKPQKKWFFDSFIESLIPPKKTNNQTKWNKEWTNTTQEDNPLLRDLDLKEQVKSIITMPDNEYSDKKLTSKLRNYISEVEKHYTTTISDYKTHIAPSFWEFKATEFNVSWILWKSYYVQSYPSYIDALWTRDILWFNEKRDMSFTIYPEEDSAIQTMLKQRATQLKAEINESIQKWITLDTEIEQQYRDVEDIRQKLTTREERYFELWYYINLYNEDEQKLKEIWRKFEQKISGYWIRLKNATQRMDEWFNSSLPICLDDLWITRSAVTSSIAWSFPFISNDLTQKTWILYWINSYTWWLVIFDRFNNDLPNMNSCILATSWAWKSFTVKLEILRYLLNWIEAIVIDPENEYKWLCDKVWWTYINIATNSQQYLNPFDIPPKIEDVEYGKWDLLRSQIMNLIWLIKILIWDLTTEDEALLDKALQDTYLLKWFSFDETSYEWKQPPIMEDLMNTLNWMDWWEKIALKLSKYVTWTFGKIFNNYTNIDINNALTVFSIRDLEDALKTPAMFNVLNFIWTKVRSHKKKRLLVCDEAWIMLRHKNSAEFLFGLIKRARKYWVWITTISQDIEDFVRSEYWKPIISNSALQILLKQSTTSIKALDSLLWLSEAEQRNLISCWIWEWLIFAWNKHIWVKILASPQERDFITTDIK